MRSSEGKNLIVRLETIHLHVADKSGPDIGKGKRFKIACTGGSMFGKRATASADAVTCPACKSTPEWNALADEFGGVRHDFDVEVDLEKMVVTRKEGD
ncbi:MAG TPA: hypothetical protein PKC18_17220 [Lacipirellulaceae bacterium]|nr:hypothetical protein [Lacipirellulaceae bacterium]HMP07593.1 hypothetical protein [Lacipirellulaceae bacterium]